MPVPYIKLALQVAIPLTKARSRKLCSCGLVILKHDMENQKD